MRFNLLLLILLLSGCASKEGERDAFLDSDVRSAAEIYNNGVDYILVRDYTRAADEFKRVEDQYPYSVWVRPSTLMVAWGYYLVNQYDEAVLNLNRYIELYPGTKESAYAYYLRAMCFYERIGETNRDSSFAERAAASFSQLIQIFPNSVYARDGRLKLELAQASLAATQMELGRYALAQGEWTAALNRFRTVILRFNKTAYTPEALHRLVEVYLTLGLRGEARRVGAILSSNYPASVWYQYSYDLLRNDGSTKKISQNTASP